MPTDKFNQKELKQASEKSNPTLTVNENAASTAEVMAVQLKSTTIEMRSPTVVNPPSNSTPPTFPNNTQGTPLFMQSVPT